VGCSTTSTVSEGVSTDTPCNACRARWKKLHPDQPETVARTADDAIPKRRAGLARAASAFYWEAA
jgi:hypothetical protein